MSDHSTGGEDRYDEDVEECEECGGEIDFREASGFYKTADERFWHEDCHDPTEKLDRVEAIRHDLIRQIIPEDCFDGLSDDFYYRLDSIQDDLDEAVRKERLRQEQDLVTDGGTTGEEAVRREAKVAADRTWQQFERLGDRLDELARDYDDEAAGEAFRSVEDLVMDLDDALHEAREAVER